MNNYPDNIRYPGDTSDPRSPFYEGGRCSECHEDYDDCDCCLKCGQIKEDCGCCAECGGKEDDCYCDVEEEEDDG